MQRKLDKDRYNDKVQRPTTSRHVPARILSKKTAYNIQNEPSRNEGLETTAHQESIDKNNETIWQKKRKKVGPRLVKVLATAGPAISNSESIDKSNETIEPGTSSSQLVVKDEPCSNEELHPALPDSSNHNVSLTPSSRESIDKNYETIWHETSSSLPVVKDEPSLFDELADTVPASSDHSDKLIPGNTDPAPNPEKPRMENLSDRNNERNRIELESSVVKDEPSVIKESASIFSARSDHSDNFTLGNAGQLTPALERRPHRQTGLTKPRTSSNSAINLDHLYQPEGVMKELTSTFPGPSDHGNYVTLSNNENLSEQNNVRNGTEHVNSVVVKDEPNLMEELTTAFPSSSNYNDSLIPSDTENLSEQNNVRNGTEHVNSVLVKDEPNLMEELTTAFPSSSNYNDSLVPPNTGSAAPSLKPKRSRKQNFSDLNIKSTQPQTSSSLPVVKEEPSLIDELAANIPGPSNYRISPSNNANSTDSDDEIRIFTEPPAPKRPRSRNRVGIYGRVFRETESVERNKRTPKEKRINQAMAAMLEQKQNETPTYTAKQGAMDLKEDFGVNVHPTTVRRLTKKIGAYAKYTKQF
ncbi:hypothetical protein DdX_16748 [Ditylenchus destructor]|uniref:Uncharacterized protein n=1 Tax=Ditylenchus destructor TaxID=166010 RepID=A0AAD4MSP6_9BILA|nr:hypothetical protein DdX_16748 [Ditylenchus destructor]